MKTIEEILAMDDTQTEVVSVPEWKTDVPVVSMSSEERSAVEKKWSKMKPSDDPGAFRYDILSRSMKKEDGTPFGTEDQFKALMKKNANAIERLFEVACRVSAWSKKDVEEIAKN